MALSSMCLQLSTCRHDEDTKVVFFTFVFVVVLLLSASVSVVVALLVAVVVVFVFICFASVFKIVAVNKLVVGKADWPVLGASLWLGLGIFLEKLTALDCVVQYSRL